MKKFFEKKENKTLFCVFIFTMVVALCPLFSKYCINGHDAEYHLLRIEALKEGILMGKPFLKVNVLFFGGAGYASSMFYPDLLLYIPALLRAANVSINLSYHIFIAVCIILTYLSGLYCSYCITKNKYAATLTAVILTLCSYHLDDIYVRAAVGEYQAFIFIPFIIYGLFNIINEKMNRPWIFGIGFAGVILCHSLSLIFSIVVTAVILVINFKKVFLDFKVFVRLVVTTILTFCATCFYTLPMLEQMKNNVFRVSSTWIEPAQEAMDFKEIFANEFPCLGTALLLIVFIRIFVTRKKDDNILKYADMLISTGLIFAVASTNLLPWERIGRHFSSIQFPWRLFIISSVFLSFAGGIVVEEVAKSRKLTRFIAFKDGGENRFIENFALITVICIMSFTAFTSFKNNDQGYYDYSNDYYSYKPFTANVIGGEWLPKAVEDTDIVLNTCDIAKTDKGEIIPIERNKNSLSLDIKNDKGGHVIENDDIEYIDVPFIYYKGYTAQDENGNELSVDGTGENGYLRVYMGNGDVKINHINVRYTGTLIQKISTAISIAAFLSLAVLVYIYIKRKNLRR